jgi:hypothetical protein
MQPSFHTAPTKPEKGTKSNTEKVQKRDGGLAQDKKPRPENHKPDTNKKH